MAFDRFIAISFPLRYHSYLTNVRTFVLIHILWIVASSFVAVLLAALLPLPLCYSKLKYTFFFVKLSSNIDKRKMGTTCLSHLIVVMGYYGPIFISSVLTRIGLVLTLEVRHGLMVGSILGPCLLNPLVYCFQSKEIKCKIFQVFKRSR
ncbi:olfactory receptor 51E2-like [Sebastes umbrosus]|uniref:olfactory receptor 51E2-like n=1 Tax=Sebastes umbrosus TaxID=72105 RepID=UPI00189EE1E3|nr:olfactory receptor 51E2-like [Sebastes umbrosus]